MTSADRQPQQRREQQREQQRERQRAIGLIDLTNLDDDCTPADVERLCERAVRFGTAGVCVWPDFVSFAHDRIDQLRIERAHTLESRGEHAGSQHEVAVVTVVNFPTGDERPYAVTAVTAQALEDGADDIDLVLPYRRFLAGDLKWCSAMLTSVRATVFHRAVLKVILETGELGDPATIKRAADFAIEHGADFVKTSTGKTPTSATPEAVGAIVTAIAEHRDRSPSRRVGIKPSGGIRTERDADEYLGMVESVLGDGWATPATFRFGASGLLDALTDA